MHVICNDLLMLLMSCRHHLKYANDTEYCEKNLNTKMIITKGLAKKKKTDNTKMIITKGLAKMKKDENTKMKETKGLKLKQKTVKKTKGLKLKQKTVFMDLGYLLVWHIVQPKMPVK